MKPTALDAPRDRLDEDEQRFVDIIREHGWFDTHVLADDEGPGFNYSTGFQVGLDHPEVIVFGLKRETASAILWDIYRAVVAGNPPPVGVPTDAFTSQLLAFLPVAPEHHHPHLGWSRWFYGGDDFACLQLVWPDREGFFPWQAGFDSPAFGKSQPDLTAGNWAGRPAS